MPATAAIWRNWHETVTRPVRRFEVLSNPDETRSTIPGYKATARRIQELILEADEGDVRLRAVGGGWSFTNVAATDGIGLGTQRLNYRFGLGPADLVKSYPPDQLPVLLQGGISVASVNRFLAGRNQALPTSGASNGQTIAGAIATGTHGAAIDVGAMQDCVVAIHLATRPDGKTLWLERQSDPILSPAARAALDVELVDDDAVFEAALVSMGCFGVVLGVVIEPVPIFWLHGWRQPIALTQAHWDAIHAMDFTSVSLPGDDRGPSGAKRRPHHVELLCNVLDGEKTFTQLLYREPARPPGSKPVSLDGGVGKGDSALDVIGVVTDALSPAAKLAAKLLSAAYQTYENVAGTPGEVFKDTSTRGRGASSAMGIPVTEARRGFDLAVAAVKAEEAPALVSMRFVKQSRATLAFTSHDPVTCILEVDGAHSARTLAAQQRTWLGVAQAKIPHTFHWGKRNELDAASVRACYGARVDAWLTARRRLLDAEGRRIFSNEFSDHLNLSL